MSIIPFGRALEKAAPKAARRSGGVPPRVDFERLEYAIRAERDRIAKANLFLDFLRAKRLTGDVEVEIIEWAYWQLIDGETFSEGEWTKVWKSMSRALGQICVKKQVRKDGKRRQVVVIPGAVQ